MGSRKVWRKPFSDRYEPKVISHNLNLDARELVYKKIYQSFPLLQLMDVYNELIEDIPSRFFKEGIAKKFETNYFNLIMKEDQDIVFEYMIRLFDWGNSSPCVLITETKNKMYIFNKILEQYGVLYEFIYDEDGFKLKEIGSRMEEEASIEALTKLKKMSWEEELTFFENAHKAYQENNAPKFFQNCYLALEKTLKRIVSESDNSKDASKMTTGQLLDFLKEKGYFPPVLGEYHKNMLESIIKANAYIAGERKKSRHEAIEKEFLVLTIHQTAATLNFLIDRHIKLKDNF